MSGGSFDYLCFKEAEELMGNTEQLEQMAKLLAELGYAEDAARESEELLCLVRQARVRLAVRQARLKGVFQAVEWWKSGDYSEAQVKEALAAYRTELEGGGS